jgi:hypothetical protein
MLVVACQLSPVRAAGRRPGRRLVAWLDNLPWLPSVESPCGESILLSASLAKPAESFSPDPPR